MTNNRYNHLYTAFILIGLLALPFLSFSQQQEEPKRVTVVVIAKEVVPQKEIVQLPADNVPKVISTATKPGSVANNIHTSPRTITAPSAIAKDPFVAKENITEKTKTSSETIKKGLPLQEKTEITKAKQEQTSVANAKDTSNPIAKSETTVPDVNVSKEVKQVGDEIATTIKLETDDKEVVKVTHSSKVNSFSYIWIGIFLIVAGVVLGLLFGKPAFLISFVGVVFITLGLII